MQSFAFLMPSKIPSFSCQEDHQSISEFITKPHISMDKKRKKKDCTYLSSVQSKMQERRIKKEDKLKKVKVEEEPPKEYIHVRARRGQATDSHSLAERVRREKISQRMKVLQALVPGCDKITGKTLMLDEIINYVQSLQNQIEFLSMKLASMSCSLHEFGLDFDGIMNQTQVANRLPRSSISEESLTVPSLLPQTNLIKPIIFEGELLKDHLNYNNSSSPMQCQGATSYSHDSDSFLIQVGDQRQGFLNQVVFNHMGPFQ